MPDKEKKKAAPDEKAAVKFTVSDANQLNALAAMLDQAYDATASQHDNVLINHSERGQMRLNQVFTHVTAELRSVANKVLETANQDDSQDDSQQAAPGGETPPASSK